MMPVVLFIISFVLGDVMAVPVPLQLSTDPEEVFVEVPRPYEFGYEFGDGLGASQYRKETADGNGLIAGNYGYVDPDGTYRSVEYKADSNGYRAIVKSNEPGLANQNSADVTFIVEPPSATVLEKTAALQSSPVGIVLPTKVVDI